MDRRTLAALRRECFGNLLARILDRTLFFFFLLIAAFSLFWLLRLGLRRALVLCVTIALLWLAASAVLRARQFSRFIAKRLDTLRRKCALEHCSLLPAEELASVLYPAASSKIGDARPFAGGYLSETSFCMIFPNHPDDPVSVRQIAGLLRRGKALGVAHLYALSLSPLDKPAHALALRYQIEQIDQETILQNLPFAVSEEELLHALSAEFEARKLPSAKRILLQKNKSAAYLLCALMLSVWPLFAGFNVLYPLLACLCLALAAASRALSRQTAPGASSTDGTA